MVFCIFLVVGVFTSIEFSQSYIGAKHQVQTVLRQQCDELQNIECPFLFQSISFLYIVKTGFGLGNSVHLIIKLHFMYCCSWYVAVLLHGLNEQLSCVGNIQNNLLSK